MKTEQYADMVIAKMHMELPRRTMVDILKLLHACNLQMIHSSEAENGIRHLLMHNQNIRLLFDQFMETTNSVAQSQFDYSSFFTDLDVDIGHDGFWDGDHRMSPTRAGAPPPPVRRATTGIRRASG